MVTAFDQRSVLTPSHVHTRSPERVQIFAETQGNELEISRTWLFGRRGGWTEVSLGSLEDASAGADGLRAGRALASRGGGAATARRARVIVRFTFASVAK